MRLEDCVGVLRLHDVEIASERLEVLAELLVRNDVLQVFLGTLVCIPLAREHVRELLQRRLVLALGHDFTNQVDIVHFLRHSHRLGIPLELAVNVKGRAEGVLHLLGVRSVVRAREQVVAHALEVVLICELDKRAEALDLEQQVYGLRLLIMIDELGDDLVDELVYFIDRLAGLHARFVVLADLASEATQVLVAPAHEFFSRAD